MQRMGSIPILCVEAASSWTSCQHFDANANAHANIDTSVNEALKVSRTKIEKLKQQIRRDINFVSLRQFVTLLIQILEVYKNCKSMY